MMLWPGLMGAYLGDAALLHASRASAAWNSCLLPVLRRRRYRRRRSQVGRLLRTQRHRPPPPCSPRWHIIRNQLRECAVAGCPYTQAFVLDLTSSPPYIQTKAGRYCWQHRPALWPS